MLRWCDAVVNGNTVYVIDVSTIKIYSYDAASDSWTRLPDCVYEKSSIIIINGLPSMVGGIHNPNLYYSNELFSLTGESSGRRWTEKFPPMPTRRCWIIALCTGTTLIVAGGWGEGGVL